LCPNGRKRCREWACPQCREWHIQQLRDLALQGIREARERGYDVRHVSYTRRSEDVDLVKLRGQANTSRKKLRKAGHPVLAHLTAISTVPQVHAHGILVFEAPTTKAAIKRAAKSSGIGHMFVSDPIQDDDHEHNVAGYVACNARDFVNAHVRSSSAPVPRPVTRTANSLFSTSRSGTRLFGRCPTRGVL
jgi:hypothetical protein